MVARQNTTPTLGILNAVDSTLAAIRKNHPELPNLVVVVGAKGATKRGQVHGHFHANQWKSDSAQHELMLSGESLARGAEATLGTIIHEAAHAIANVRGIKDTSNNGRYHSKKFKDIGEELGLSLETAPTIGWSKTSLAEGTAVKYAKQLSMLTEALVAYKVAPFEAAAPKPRKKTKAPMDCGCGDPVTVSIQWFEGKGPITCGDCLEDFKLVTE